MNISAHDYSNQFYPGSGWDLSWSSQKLVSSSQVTSTGGTYEVRAPVTEPDKMTVSKKTKKK
jgi:hypothetical protein